MFWNESTAETSMVDFQGDFAVGVHLGSDVNIDAHIEILKLGIYQRIDSHSADAGLERTSCDGHSFARFSRRLFGRPRREFADSESAYCRCR